MTDWSFQDRGATWLRGRPTALLGDDAGLGKSKQLLQAAEGRTLVIAPAFILAAGVWTDEHQKWAPNLDLTQAPYSSLCDLKVVKTRTKPQVIDGQETGEILEIPVYGSTDKVRPELKGPWDTLIYDEAHYLKNRKTTWTTASFQIEADRTWLATGTTVPNWAYELFVTLQKLYPEKAQAGGEFGSYWRWVKKWFKTWKPPYAPGSIKIGGLRDCDKECHSLPDCIHWQVFREENLGDRYLRRERDDVLTDLPPLIGPQEMLVKMHPAQKKAYEALKKDYITWIEETGNEVVAWSSGGLHTKLAQAATGLETLDPGASGSGKLDVLASLIQDRAHPCLVVAHFRNTVDAVEDLCITGLGRRTCKIMGGMTKPKIRKTVQDFQAGRFDVMVATIDTIREGVTLTRADTVIRVERTWRPDWNDQVMRRLHRIGQTRPVTVIDLITEGTYEREQLRTLANKTVEQAKAVTARDFAAML